MTECPKCKRTVPPKNRCMYCGTPLTTAPTSISGMNAAEWLQEGARAYQLEERERALTCFDNVLNIDPKHAIAWVNKAIVLAEMKKLPEALAAAEEALELSPSDGRAKSLTRELKKEMAGEPPPGKPWKTMLAMLRNGGPAEAYIIRASTSLFKDLELFSGPEEIAVANWLVTLPPEKRDLRGRPLWETGSLREECALFHVVLRDRTAYTFRYETDEEVSQEKVTEAELCAYGALLENRVLKEIGLCANRPFCDDIRARVDGLNTKLDLMDVPEPHRVVLYCVDDTLDQPADEVGGI